MKHLPPHEQIAALRTERGDTLAVFASAIGCSSKGRVSEMENGKAVPTVAQALAIERLAGGRINAADLNCDVAAARAPGWQLTPAELAAVPGNDAGNDDLAESADALPDLVPDLVRVAMCEVCDAVLDDARAPACTFVDCPHRQGVAA